MSEFKSLVSKYASTSTPDLMRALKRTRSQQKQEDDESSSSSSAPGSQSTPVVLDLDDDDDDDDGQTGRQGRGAKKMVKREDAEDIQLVPDSPLTRRTNMRNPSSTTTSSRAITAASIKTNPLRQRTTRSSTTTTTTSLTTVQDGNQGPSGAVKIDQTVKVERQQTRTIRTTNSVNGYTPPAVYAHLDFVPDHIDYDLDVLFVGINPGVRTSEQGHHYSGPTNHFWPCLNDSGLLPPGTRLTPKDDHTLPARFRLGLTNLVDRPSRSGAELSSTEARAAAPILMAKIRKFRPRFVCFVSKQAWDMFSGIGLGLQMGFVRWGKEEEEEDDDEGEEEDQEQFKSLVRGEEDRPSFRNHAVQKAKDDRGVAPYAMGPFFKDGPAVERLDAELAKEGVPVHFNIVKQDDEDDKQRVGRGKKEEEDDKSGVVGRVKKEEEEDKSHVVGRVKKEEDDDKSRVIGRIKKEEEQEMKEEDARLGVKKEQGNDDDHGAIVNGSSSSPSAPRRRRRRPVFEGSRMFVMPSTSGRVTQYRKEDKLAFFRQLAELVRQDRLDRGLQPIGGL